MAVIIPGIQSSNAILFSQKAEVQHKTAEPPASLHVAGQMTFSVRDNPTELILRAATEKINAMFAPHLGDGAIEQAAQSGMDMSPEATADRILAFASQMIGRAESKQLDLPIAQQTSRAQLFENIKVGIEKGFEQARGILDGMQALEGDVKDTVNNTYDSVQQGLDNLAQLLGLLPPDNTTA
ncbi:hypothetical protein D8Y20_10690 [Mariprofundus sp. EBB-1]|uniref:DUF5610 domain-containing protein n=1 Tax=Mariprofundus sp. EBB-1 TaxID=2650971 RepID=UPI000EF18FBC|nr:DUF5610 domain-containing protein [Mariprofundus sp. EBB-1]RLL50947.1 hypothetical protein D8Y20_10690 [Mariprofundus sp. EBB-1]